MGWISFCNLVLVEKLHALEKLLDQMCHYLTTRDEVSKKYFTKGEVEWRMATQISGETRDGLFGCNDFEYGQSYKYSLHRYFGF